jgi:hypothetical protein
MHTIHDIHAYMKQIMQPKQVKTLVHKMHIYL